MDGSLIDGWMRALAQGDRSAFTPLFEALSPPVLEVCRRMLPAADVDDAAQTALMRVFERASEYDVKRPALPWALGIAAWECRTLRQRRARAKEVAAPIPEGGEALDVVEQRQLLELVTATLGTLGDADREVLLDAYWERAVVSGATQRKRKQRALDRLRDAFRRLYGLE